MALLALLSCLIAVDSVRAGSYVMRNCDVPGYPNNLLGPWEIPVDVFPALEVDDSCATGGGVRFAVAGRFGDGVETSIVLRPRSDGPQSQVKILKAVLYYAARLTGTGLPMFFKSQQRFADGTLENSTLASPPGSGSIVIEQLLRPDFTDYILDFACGLGGPTSADACVPDDPVPLQIRGIEVTLSENIPPFLASPTGSLLSAGPQSGVAAVNYVASDPQSGLTRVDALIDGNVAASQDLSTRCEMSDFTVCPASDNGTLQVDTRSIPNGTHALALRARDAAGNEQTVTATNPIEVMNVPAAVPQIAYALTAGFKASSRPMLTVPFGARVSLRGRMLQGVAPGPVGARIDVLERVGRSGARERLVGSAQTKAGGVMTFVLRAGRPSRSVRLAYQPVGGAPAFSSPLELRVRAGSSLRVSLHGLVLRFHGRVRGGLIPKGGKLVRMEGRAPNSAWKTFANVHTDRHGSFSGSYRLRLHRPGVVLRVRAALPKQANYPFMSSRTHALALRVR